MKILRLYQRILRGGSFRISVNGANADSGTLPGTGSGDNIAEVEKLLLYLSDLDVVQRHCETSFPAPLAYTDAERIDLLDRTATH
ncbi:hypothetical protein ACFZDJ_52730 [Streptomyces sp. NPDC007896]|uniref:hypothetical protein n=1 Tax=Streptomyces sp. NPDC007896 TaxID=3364784 RepID=UPI0036EFF044